MKFSQPLPINRLPALAEWGLLVFPLAPGWGAICLGLQLLLLLKQFGKNTFLHPVAWILGGLSLWFFVVSAIAPYPLDSLLGIANFLPFFLFFLAFSRVLTTQERLERLAWLFVVPSLFVTGIGLGELWFGWRSPDWIWHLFGWELTGAGNPPGRLASTFMYANICGAYLLMAFLLGLGLWLQIFRETMRRQSFRQLIQGKCFLYLTVTLVFDAIALILTNSRNAWAIAFLGGIIYAVYVGWWWVCGFAGGLTAAVLGASFGEHPLQNSLRKIVPYYFWGRLSDKMYQDRPTADLRTTQWQFTLDLIGDRPVTGWGIRSFSPLYEEAMGTWLGHPHNLYLMLTSEMGIPAAGLLMGTVGWILARGIQTWRSPGAEAARPILFTYLMAFGGFCLFNLLDVTMLDLRLNTFAWLLLAGIWGLGQEINRAGDQGQPDSAPEENLG